MVVTYKAVYKSVSNNTKFSADNCGSAQCFEFDEIQTWLMTMHLTHRRNQPTLLS